MYCVDSGTYSGSTSLPTVLAGKCDGTTCTTLTTDVTALKACMSTPTNAACTATYGSAGKSFKKKFNNSSCFCTVLTIKLWDDCILCSFLILDFIIVTTDIFLNMFMDRI